MGRVNTPILTKSSLTALEKGINEGKSAAFRKRCQVIILKSQGRSSKDVGQIIGMSHVSVNSWLKRYKESGILGLYTRSGRGRKPKLTKKMDGEQITAIVKSHRQRLKLAKAEWESQSGKQVSMSTFKTFLKALVANINE